MKIGPVNQEWTHRYMLEPYLQGAEMVNLAWKGVNFSYVAPVPLSLAQRVVSWVVGVSLLLPFINTIFWIAWQTFGKPEKLFDPYCPERAPLPPPQPIVRRRPVPPPAAGDKRFIETYTYKALNPASAQEINLKIERNAAITIAREKFGNATAESFYNPDGKIFEYHYQHIDDEFSVTHNDRKLQAYVAKSGSLPFDEMLDLTEDLPWIQQPELGLKSFVLSNQSEIKFYTVVPKKLLGLGLLQKGVAKKLGEEDLPGFGKAIKVEVRSDVWLLSHWKMVMWFDPATGNLIKLVDPGAFIKGGGEFCLKEPHHRLHG